MDLSSLFKKSNNKLGLALGGGAALGAAHIGVLKALKEKDLELSYLTGTSIGSFASAHIAFGTSIERLKEIALELDWLDISGFKLSKMGLLSNKKLGKMILDELGKKNIEDAEIPLSLIATDISSGNKIILKEGPLHKAVMASSCLPGVFTPIEWNDLLLVDGFLCENVPISPLIEMGAKKVIAVDLTTNKDYKRPEDIIDVLSNTFDIGLNNMIKNQIEGKKILWIQPKLSAYNKVDTKQTKKLIDEVYKAAIAALSR